MNIIAYPNVGPPWIPATLSGIPTCGLGYAGTVDHRCGGPGDVACGVGRLIDEDHHQAQEGEVGSNGHCLE